MINSKFVQWIQFNWMQLILNSWSTREYIIYNYFKYMQIELKESSVSVFVVAHIFYLRAQ